MAATTEAGTCGWHDPARVDRIKNGDRTCQRCGVAQPADHFYASGHGIGRRRVCIRCIGHERFQKSGRHRHPRYNARGEVWCSCCKRYLGSDQFKRHPYRPNTYWSYCKPCTRAKDRERYHRTKFRPDKAAGAFERTRRKTMVRQRELRERRAFCAKAIHVLGCRGFTLSQIARLIDVSVQSIYGWRAQDRTVTEAVEARFVIALQATGHLPIGDRPAYRDRLPHPELASIAAEIAPEIARHPVRSSWVNGNRTRKERTNP